MNELHLEMLSTLGDRLTAIGYVDVDVRTNPFAWACHARRPID